MNPRYINYCRVKNLPLEPIEKVYLFTIWITNKWQQWINLTGANPDHHTEQDHINFDLWLNKETE
jgi:hypothetical protein